jgi:hypothetical protein
VRVRVGEFEPWDEDEERRRDEDGFFLNWKLALVVVFLPVVVVGLFVERAFVRLGLY